MIRSKHVTTMVVTIEHDDASLIPLLVDYAAQRMHTVDGVNAATSTLIGTVEQKDAGKWVATPYSNPTQVKG